MQASAHGFIDFVQDSPSPFHAASVVSAILNAAGFTQLEESKPFNVQPGGRYFVTRNNSSVIAFTIPACGLAPLMIVSSHSDSPTFKLKPNFEDIACGKYLRLNTQRYGGMIMSSWMDRPLSIAGRLLVREGNALVTCLTDLKRDAVLIPNMPIHFNREVNDGYRFNPQVDMLPLYGSSENSGSLMQSLADAASVNQQDIVACDLFLYNRTPGSVWGAEDAYFSCARIDDLACSYTSLCAFLTADCSVPHINMFCMFDNEQVGSGTKQGANSPFLTDTLSRAASALGADENALRQLVASSFMVSADNAHAVHPNHPEKFDANNRTWMNCGVVIKHNANQKYTTDAVSCAIFSEICRRADVPVQHFTNRSDVLGGSTLGNISNTQLALNTVDIGLPQLAMHSSYETAGCKDLDYMTRALTAFYNTHLSAVSDGYYTIES